MDATSKSLLQAYISPGGGEFLTGKDFHGKRTVLVVAAATAAPRPQHKCHGGSFS